MCVCVCMYVLRIVSMDKILHFINTLIIVRKQAVLVLFIYFLKKESSRAGEREGEGERKEKEKKREKNTLRAGFEPARV